MPELEVNGIKIESDIHVSDIGYAPRTWKERLLERPWRPLQSRKQIYEPRVYVMKDGVAIVSPQTFLIIKRECCLKNGVIVGPLIDTLKVRKALRGE